MNGRFQSEITNLGIILQSNENKTLVSLNFSIIITQTIMRMRNNLKYLYENVKYEMIIHSNDSISLISIVVLIFASIFSIIANSGLFIVIYVVFFKNQNKKMMDVMLIIIIECIICLFRSINFKL